MMGLEVVVVAGMAVVASGAFGAIATWAIMRIQRPVLVEPPLARKARSSRAHPPVKYPSKHPSPLPSLDPGDFASERDDTRPTLVPFAGLGAPPPGLGFSGGLSGHSGLNLDASEDEDDVPTTLYQADGDDDVAALLAELDGESPGRTAPR